MLTNVNTCSITFTKHLKQHKLYSFKELYEVIDNTSKSNKIEDMVFWYKADDHASFTMGSPEFWQHHTSNFRDKFSDDPEEEFSLGTGKKKNTPTINVKKRF